LITQIEFVFELAIKFATEVFETKIEFATTPGYSLQLRAHLL